MNSKEVEKNVLDLKYQHYISLRNIFFGATITTLVAYVKFVNSLPLNFTLKISIASSIISLIFFLGLYFWSEAKSTVNEIRNLSD